MLTIKKQKSYSESSLTKTTLRQQQYLYRFFFIIIYCFFANGKDADRIGCNLRSTSPSAIAGGYILALLYFYKSETPLVIMGGKDWSEKDISYLKKYHKTILLKDIAIALNRTRKGVENKSSKLGLNNKNKLGRGEMNQGGSNNNNWKGGISKNNYYYTKRSKMKYPGKNKTREILRYAIKRGEIIRPSICPKCGEKKRIEGHHENYSKPLEVEWVCRKCHNLIHKNLKRRKS